MDSAGQSSNSSMASTSSGPGGAVDGTDALDGFHGGSSLNAPANQQPEPDVHPATTQPIQNIAYDPAPYLAYLNNITRNMEGSQAPRPGPAMAADVEAAPSPPLAVVTTAAVTSPAATGPNEQDDLLLLLLSAQPSSPIVLSDASPTITPVRKRPRNSEGTPKGTPKRATPLKVVPEDDDDGSTCPICLDSWEMTGEHRLTSLKCGHLFGDSCIRRWFAGFPASVRTCPSCKNKANLRDLRNIYAKRVGVVDKSEEYRLQQLLDDEISKVGTLNQNLALIKLELELQRKYTARIESQLEQTKLDALNLNASLMSASQHQQHQQCSSVNTSLASSAAVHNGSISTRTSSTSSFASAGAVYKLSRECTISICPEAGCRVMIHGRRSNTLLVSQKSTQTLFAGFGVRFVDMPSFRLTSFMHMATKEIRDLAIDADEQTVVAASLERSCKMYNTHNRGCFSTFTPHSDKPIWSVAFDKARTRTIYFGSQHGSTFVYDVRQPGTCLEEYRTVRDTSPVISICSVPPSGVDFPFGGFLVCKLQSIWFYEYKADQTVTATKLAISGPFASMSFREDGNTVLLATRPKALAAGQLIYAELRKVAQTPALLELATESGSRVQKHMTRCAQLRVEQATLVTAYMQDTKNLQTWRVAQSHQLQQQSVLQQALPIEECIFDLCPIYGMGCGGSAAVQQWAPVYVGALTDSKCRIFKVINGDGGS